MESAWVAEPTPLLEGSPVRGVRRLGGLRDEVIQGFLDARGIGGVQQLPVWAFGDDGHWGSRQFLGKQSYPLGLAKQPEPWNQDTQYVRVEM